MSKGHMAAAFGVGDLECIEGEHNRYHYWKLEDGDNWDGPSPDRECTCGMFTWEERPQRNTPLMEMLIGTTIKDT